MLKNSWKIKNNRCADHIIWELAQSLGVSSGMAKTLAARGICQRDDFIKLREETVGKADPYLLPDMEACVKRIRQAVSKGEKILIYGDYDADGVTSVALMYLFLKNEGAVVDYHIPDRFTEGYGMNKEVISSLAEKGIGLIITVDTGISANEEIGYAKELGMDTVVTDHHECLNGIPENAVCAVNPQRQDCRADFRGYSGVGVAFMVAMAYKAQFMPLEEARELIYESYSDIASIGTVADVMSLTGENKAIVKKGLSLIERGVCNPGIKALILAAKGHTDKVTSSTVGFILGPRINAAGRMSHASQALELFLCNDFSQCCEIAKKLCLLNSRRQTEEMKIFGEACEMLENGDGLNKRVIVMGSEDWNHGVIGIVCSRIVEKYKRPAILFSFDGENAKGSGRSPGGFDLAKAIDGCAEHIVKYGGHELAAGLTVKRDKLDNFEKAINEYADSLELDFGVGCEYEIDAVLRSTELTLPFAKELEMLEPFGQDNPEPLFLLTSCKVEDIKLLSQGKHTKLVLSSERISFEALVFNYNGEEEGIEKQDKINIVFTLEVNEYMGKKKVMLNVKDLCFDSELENRMEYLNNLYQSGKKLGVMMPLRNHFVELYKKLFSLCREGERQICYRDLLVRDLTTEGYIRLRMMLDVLSGCGLIRVVYLGVHKIKVTICKTDKKIDIEKSQAYMAVKNRIQ